MRWRAECKDCQWYTYAKEGEGREQVVVRANQHREMPHEVAVFNELSLDELPEHSKRTRNGEWAEDVIGGVGYDPSD